MADYIMNSHISETYRNHRDVCVQELDVVHDDRVELEESLRLESESETNDPHATRLDR